MDAHFSGQFITTQSVEKKIPTKLGNKKNYTKHNQSICRAVFGFLKKTQIPQAPFFRRDKPRWISPQVIRYPFVCKFSVRFLQFFNSNPDYPYQSPGAHTHRASCRRNKRREFLRKSTRNYSRYRRVKKRKTLFFLD